MNEIEVRNLIVESATKFFTRFGFNKTTMNEIAKNIHKAKGVLYYYFNSKEALYNEVLKQELGFIKTELSMIFEKEGDSLQKLNNYVHARFKLLYSATTYHETLKADFFEKYHFVKDVRSDFEKFEFEQLKSIIEKGKIEGYFDFKDIESTVEMFLMILQGIEIPFYLQSKYPKYENTLEELSNMIVNGLKSNM